jgi:hypothetical protein
VLGLAEEGEGVAKTARRRFEKYRIHIPEVGAKPFGKTTAPKRSAQLSPKCKVRCAAPRRRPRHQEVVCGGREGGGGYYLANPRSAPYAESRKTFPARAHTHAPAHSRGIAQCPRGRRKCAAGRNKSPRAQFAELTK